MMPSGGFGQDADAHLGFDHAAHGLEAGELDTQIQSGTETFHLIPQEIQQAGALAQTDVLVVQGLPQGDLGLAGQGVPGGHDQRQAIHAVGQDLQIARFDQSGGDAQIRCPVDHAPDDVTIEALLQIHRHTRAIREIDGQQSGEKLGDRRRVGEDADMAGGVTAVLGEFAFEKVDLAHDETGMLQQALARWRELDATTVTVEQANAELAFEGLHSRAGGGRRQGRAACALGQAGRLGDMDEKPQVSQVEMHARVLRAFFGVQPSRTPAYANVNSQNETTPRKLAMSLSMGVKHERDASHCLGGTNPRNRGFSGATPGRAHRPHLR
ncbi:hypothetical protein COLO4_01767 [Corchorus olitorius]|uniref:Uncharacterized protein n=1 Tax=Corchorus olitorius TaxID=93759 RepID=A0A1R3L208_9ROSI|nr:hypothetical protein COLO4_01767 [Corchorus olitorius]